MGRWSPSGSTKQAARQTDRKRGKPKVGPEQVQNAKNDRVAADTPKLQRYKQSRSNRPDEVQPGGGTSAYTQRFAARYAVANEATTSEARLMAQAAREQRDAMLSQREVTWGQPPASARRQGKAQHYADVRKDLRYKGHDDFFAPRLYYDVVLHSHTGTDPQYYDRDRKRLVSLKYEGAWARTSCSQKLGNPPEPFIPPGSHTKHAPSRLPVGPSNSSSVFLSGLPEGISEADVLKAFRKFGEIQKIFLDRRLNCGIVDFTECYQARRLVACGDNGVMAVPIGCRQQDPAQLKVGLAEHTARDAEDRRRAADLVRERNVRAARAERRASQRPHTAPARRGITARSSQRHSSEDQGIQGWLVLGQLWHTGDKATCTAGPEEHGTEEPGQAVPVPPAPPVPRAPMPPPPRPASAHPASPARLASTSPDTPAAPVSPPPVPASAVSPRRVSFSKDSPGPPSRD